MGERLTPEQCGEAITQASKILRGLGTEITVDLLARRAARIHATNVHVMKNHIHRILNPEERLALGIKRGSKPSSATE